MVGGWEWDWFVTQLNGRDVVLLTCRDLGETVSGPTWAIVLSWAKAVVDEFDGRVAPRLGGGESGCVGELEVPAAEVE